LNQMFCPNCGHCRKSEFVFCGVIAQAAAGSDTALWESRPVTPPRAMKVRDERWIHQYGCAQWIRVTRDLRNKEVLKVYRIERSEMRGEGDL